jgi:RimJ/RimL family protein N-acetyltransferase
LNDRHEQLREDASVLIRTLRPEDAALYPDFLSAVNSEDLRLRFFAPTAQVSDALIDKLTHLDYSRAMAFIAIEEATGKMLGVVRLHDDPGDKSAEFAILLRSHLKGHGLGWLLMRRMMEFAKEKRLESVHGQVLSENTAMLQMCEEFGFLVADDPDERGVKRVVLPVADAEPMLPH